MQRIGKLNRVKLASLLPTPVEELVRLEAELRGPKLLIKRDDLTGLAFGGNKTRKLEFLVADALSQGADTLVTCGAVQSNHVRQTAAAAAKYGLDAVLLLTGSQRQPGGELLDGNQLLDVIMGAELRYGHRSDMNDIAEELKKNGKKPYIIPLGGSTEVGVLGYVNAFFEIVLQLHQQGIEADYFVLAVGSGGTHAGLLMGSKLLSGLDIRIIGISVSEDKEEISEQIVDLTNRTASFLGSPTRCRLADVIVYDDYIGAGYGVPDKADIEVIERVARREGIILDPVYTGKAMRGLIELISHGEFKKGETVVFWHTGGTPAIFTYKGRFQPQPEGKV